MSEAIGRPLFQVRCPGEKAKRQKCHGVHLECCPVQFQDSHLNLHCSVMATLFTCRMTSSMVC